jgi:hypothetical protein
MSRDASIKTQLKDQRLGDEARGERLWRSAELVGESWYLVERCVEVDGHLVVRKWIAASIHECARLLNANECQWSRLLAYVRVPLSAGAGFVFGEVTDVHELSMNRGELVRFTNGMTVLLEGAGLSDKACASRTEELRMVFTRSPFVAAQPGACATATGVDPEYALEREPDDYECGMNRSSDAGARVP